MSPVQAKNAMAIKSDVSKINAGPSSPIAPGRKSNGYESFLLMHSTSLNADGAHRSTNANGCAKSTKLPGKGVPKRVNGQASLDNSDIDMEDAKGINDTKNTNVTRSATAASMSTQSKCESSSSPPALETAGQSLGRDLASAPASITEHESEEDGGPTAASPASKSESLTKSVDEPLSGAKESAPSRTFTNKKSGSSKAVARSTNGKTDSLDKSDSALLVSPTTGQVRPRDDDDEEEEEEHSVKRTKLSPEDDAVLNVNSENINMAPPPTPSTTSAPADWDSKPMTETQRKYIHESIRKAKKTKAAIPFLHPVDPIALNIPNYPEIITKPMDLSTLEEGIKTSRFHTANDFWADFEMIAQNAATFNGPDHVVTHSGFNLKAYFRKMMEMLPKGDVILESVKKKSATTVVKPTASRRESRSATTVKPSPTPAPVAPSSTPANTQTKSVPSKTKQEPKKHEAQLDANGVPVIRRDSESNRPKREIIKPPPRDLPYTIVKPKKKQTQLELKFCEITLKEMKKPKHAAINYAFLNPVDAVALNIPSYFTIVKKPMDFGTMEKKLSDSTYNSAKEFYADAKLVFTNCYSFNPAGDPINGLGKALEKVFDEQWKKKDEYITANMPPSEPPSEVESEEESEESEIEDIAARMIELQKQITALSAEMIMLSKAQQPKKSKKKDKRAKGDKSKRVRTNSSVPTKKTSKSAKPAKVTKLSLEQKRYISDGIATLDEPSMRKAVQIIRNGVPKLKDVHDDELELDVDEISDNVLHELLRFVKTNRASAGADEEDDDYEAVNVKQHSTTQRKKSKPMSAREQESKIQQVRQQLQQFEHQSGSDRNDGGQENSSGDDSSSSEEE